MKKLLLALILPLAAFADTDYSSALSDIYTQLTEIEADIVAGQFDVVGPKLAQLKILTSSTTFRPISSGDSSNPVTSSTTIPVGTLQVYDLATSGQLKTIMGQLVQYITPRLKSLEATISADMPLVLANLDSIKADLSSIAGDIAQLSTVVSTLLSINDLQGQYLPYLEELGNLDLMYQQDTFANNYLAGLSSIQSAISSVVSNFTDFVYAGGLSVSVQGADVDVMNRDYTEILDYIKNPFYTDYHQFKDDYSSMTLGGAMRWNSHSPNDLQIGDSTDSISTTGDFFADVENLLFRLADDSRENVKSLILITRQLCSTNETMTAEQQQDLDDANSAVDSAVDASSELTASVPDFFAFETGEVFEELPILGEIPDFGNLTGSFSVEIPHFGNDFGAFYLTVDYSPYMTIIDNARVCMRVFYWGMLAAVLLWAFGHFKDVVKFAFDWTFKFTGSH